ncbi:hypothetical protein EA187_09255 [Lujinxingia sediminis]|uniref:HEPN domain-containing protein n=1 Tax=Lujinxingia sediminis TaxID=2480984 RepID=A0ABY0CSY8_9DELT|nr:hypothetical protein [Lujinxingia sediminis]RVU44720.1 hypothetical protein EA187_09255 [Lujinxingia sediminis]
MTVTRDQREAWASAYVDQAREDLRVAQMLQGRHPSVLAMLLQMVFEKLAKAALLYSKKIDVEDAQRTHKAAESLMAIFRTHPRFLGVFPGTSQRRWLPTAKLVAELTRLHPQIARGGPHLEYPWEREDGTIGVPARDLEPLLESLWGSPQGQLKRLSDLFTFARILADNAEKVFG